MPFLTIFSSFVQLAHMIILSRGLSYTINENNKTWKQAQDICIKGGARLAIIEQTSEEIYLRHLVTITFILLQQSGKKNPEQYEEVGKLTFS